MSEERIASMEKFNQQYIDDRNQKMKPKETLTGAVTE
jgi:hypothetical protein